MVTATEVDVVANSVVDVDVDDAGGLMFCGGLPPGGFGGRGGPPGGAF